MESQRLKISSCQLKVPELNQLKMIAAGTQLCCAPPKFDHWLTPTLKSLAVQSEANGSHLEASSLCGETFLF